MAYNVFKFAEAVASASAGLVNKLWVLSALNDGPMTSMACFAAGWQRLSLGIVLAVLD